MVTSGKQDEQSEALLGTPRLAAHTGAALLVALVAGCASPELSRDEYLPADWPDVAVVGADCRGIEGTFTNRGMAVDERGQRKEVWFTDLLMPTLNWPKRPLFDELRTCERVTLKVDEFSYEAGGRELKSWRLVIEPRRQIASDALAGEESCPSLRLPPGRPWPYATDRDGGRSGVGLCQKNNFRYAVNPGGDEQSWELGVGNDGTLLVKIHKFELWTIPPAFMWLTTDNA